MAFMTFHSVGNSLTFIFFRGVKTSNQMEHKEKHTYQFYIQIKIQQKMPLIVSSQSQTDTKSEAITMKNRWIFLKNIDIGKLKQKMGRWFALVKDPTEQWLLNTPVG